MLGKNPRTLQIPLGGTPDDVRANNYFPTARGLQSVEYLISKVRARLRMRARAVDVGWKAAFRHGVGLSCRKNATLYDPRMPGGTVTGRRSSRSAMTPRSGSRTTNGSGSPISLGPPTFPSTRRTTMAKIRLEFEIDDSDWRYIKAVIDGSDWAEKTGGICSHGTLDLHGLVRMLLTDVALSVRRPGSWEGSNMLQVLTSHGYDNTRFEEE